MIKKYILLTFLLFIAFKVSANPLTSDETVNNATALVQMSIQYGSSTYTIAGTGILISSNGFVITCAHLFYDYRKNVFYNLASDINLTFDMKVYLKAQMVLLDIDRDIALLKCNNFKELPKSVQLSDKLPEDKTQVNVRGYPLIFDYLINNIRINSSLTQGIISGIKEKASKYSGTTYKIIEFDATANQGNSGGALYDSESGIVYGIVTEKLTESSGINFAIPSIYILSILNNYNISNESKFAIDNFNLYINGIRVKDKYISVHKNYKDGKDNATLSIEFASNVTYHKEDIFIDVLFPSEVINSATEVINSEGKLMEGSYDSQAGAKVYQFIFSDFTIRKDVRKHICNVYLNDIRYGRTNGYLIIDTSTGKQKIEFDLFFD